MKDKHDNELKVGSPVLFRRGDVCCKGIVTRFYDLKYTNHYGCMDNAKHADIKLDSGLFVIASGGELTKSTNNINLTDKYGVMIAVGDEVVINSHNIFSGKDTFEKGVVTRLYAVVDKERPETTRLELAEIELHNGKIIDTVGKSGIIAI